MDWFDRDPEIPHGGRARDASSGCYHLSFRSGSRSLGSSAASAHAYITRTDAYDDAERDPAVYTESGQMPSWAEDDPADYWDAADLYERANGRLYVSADFALPCELSAADQIELAHGFAHNLTADERLPYTLAIHAGLDADGREHNPHAHLMISERQNDGIDRDRQQWFRRANSRDPARGGAPKTRAIHGRDWMERARERWAARTNAILERNGRADRVDHRSYARQGVDREPGRHFGPAAAHMVSRGQTHNVLTDAADQKDRQVALTQLERTIAALERAIAAGREQPDERQTGRSEPPWRPSERSDSFPGR